MREEKKITNIQFARLVLVLLLGCLFVWLCGCGKKAEEYEGKRFFIEVSLYSTDKIYSVGLDRYQEDSLLGTGAVCNANGTPLKDSIRFEFRDTDFEKDFETVPFFFQLQVSDSLENGEENTSHWVKVQNVEEAFLPEDGKTYRYVLDGDFESGFLVMKPETYR